MERHCPVSPFHADENLPSSDHLRELYKHLERQRHPRGLGEPHANRGGTWPAASQGPLGPRNTLRGNIPQGIRSLSEFQLPEATDLDGDASKRCQDPPLYQAYAEGLIGMVQTPPNSGMINLGTNLDASFANSGLDAYHQELANYQSQLEYNLFNSGFQIDASHLNYLNAPMFFGVGPPPPTPATPFLLSNMAHMGNFQAQATLSSTPTSAPSPFGLDNSLLDSILPPPALPPQAASMKSPQQPFELSLGPSFDAGCFEVSKEMVVSFRKNDAIALSPFPTFSNLPNSEAAGASSTTRRFSSAELQGSLTKPTPALNFLPQAPTPPDLPSLDKPSLACQRCDSLTQNSNRAPPGTIRHSS